MPRVRERSRGRLIDNVSEGVLCTAYCLCRAAAPDALSTADSLTNSRSTCWQPHDEETVIRHNLSTFSVNRPDHRFECPSGVDPADDPIGKTSLRVITTPKLSPESSPSRLLSRIVGN